MPEADAQTLDVPFLPAAGILVDMDGVLVESAETVERHWSAWAARRGLPLDEVLALAHGSPVRTVMACFVADGDVASEEAWFEALAFDDPGEDVALPGAGALLGQGLLPVAVVTSASAAIARHRLERAGLPEPLHLVAADDVEHGKPHPEPYLTGAERLGLPAARCVAVEDAPDGARSALAAGATTIAVLVSHRRDRFRGVHHVVADLTALRIVPGGVRVRGDGRAGARVVDDR